MVTSKYQIIPVDIEMKLEKGFRQAGQEYLEALKKLGLDPEGLLWAYDHIIEKMVLILITPIYDIAGSLTLRRTLIKAYNLAATPKEITPFIVRLHSPDQTIVGALSDLLNVMKLATQNNPNLNVEKDKSFGFLGEFLTQQNFIYKFEIKKKNRETQMRQWKRFNDNIEKLERLAA